jgi:hypothetical protein
MFHVILNTRKKKNLRDTVSTCTYHCATPLIRTPVGQHTTLVRCPLFQGLRNNYSWGGVPLQCRLNTRQHPVYFFTHTVLWQGRVGYGRVGWSRVELLTHTVRIVETTPTERSVELTVGTASCREQCYHRCHDSLPSNLTDVTPQMRG